jgi:5-hydroxyisourate hydrolase
MTFFTQEYYQTLGTQCFYPQVEIQFRIIDPKIHHHVPLLISPFGFSTYKGS